MRHIMDSVRCHFRITIPSVHFALIIITRYVMSADLRHETVIVIHVAKDMRLVKDGEYIIMALIVVVVEILLLIILIFLLYDNR